MTDEAPLTPEEYQVAAELFAELAEASTAERDRRLADDSIPPRVRAELASLLGVDPAGAFAEARLGAVGRAMLDEPGPTRPPERIGPFRILEVLGEGGMGTVYLAEQSEPIERRVALKVIRSGLDSEQVLSRFRGEQRALARMEHPHIARVLEGGVTDGGQPYFVMEYVAGTTITRYCDDHRLDICRRLELFVKVCQAIQHAHQRGFLHRDLKPSNVLVTEQDGEPVPKVIDFGVAKAMADSLAPDATRLTASQQLVGTPEYMAPEQVTGGEVDLDTRVDVYALGVLLYELLTGTVPLDVDTAMRSGFEAMIRTIREVEPPAQSTRISTITDRADLVAARRRLMDARRLRLALRGELDWIVGRALEKDRERRYPSALEFGADVRRHLDGDPVLARPTSAVYRIRKLVRRHRLAFVAAATVFAALITGIAGIGYGLSEARRELDRANATKSLLVQMLESAAPEIALGADTRLLRGMLDRTAAELLDGSISDPLIRFDLHGVAGSTYLSLGANEAAETHLRALLALGAVPEDDPRLIDARLTLADVLRFTGRFDELGALLDALRPRITELAGSHPDRELRFRFAEVQLRLRRDGLRSITAAMEQLAHDALAAFGERHSRTTQLRHELATHYRDLGRTEEARRLLETQLAILEDLHGAESPRCVAVQESLLFLDLDRGRYQEAERLARRVARIHVQQLGEDNPKALGAHVPLATVLASTDRGEEALPLLERIRDLPESELPADAETRLLALNVLGNVYLRMQRIDEARELFETVVAGFDRTLGPESDRALPTRNNLVLLYMQRGELEEAERLALETLEREREILGPDHPMTLALRVYLSSVYLQSDRAERAHELLLPTAKALLAREGPRGRFAGYALQTLSAVCATLGREDDTFRLTSAALETTTSAAAAEDATPLLLEQAVADLLHHPDARLRDPARALPLAERLLALPDRRSTRTWTLLADARLGSGDPARALEALREARDLLTEDEPIAAALDRRIRALEQDLGGR